MRNKVLAAGTSAVFGLAMSASAAFAGYMQPGETMGVSLLSPLPEGVFFADLEDYGRTDGASGGVGVNIPVVIWSTPFSFYNTRLEFIAALPFVHVDGPTLNTVGAITWAAGPLLAHDFGNGLTGGLGVLVRTPSPSSFIAENVDGRTAFELDFRQSAQYKYAGPGLFEGVTFIENAAYTSALGNNNYGPFTAAGTPVQNDFFAGDFTIEKTFGKFTIGFTGFGNIDTENRNFQGRVSNVELGGLVGYDFGKFSLTGIVTRTVLTETGGISNGAYETRGWMRLIVPLYVAPTAPVIAARY